MSGLASTKPVVKSNSQARAVIARSAATKQSSSCPRSWLVSHCPRVEAHGHEKPHSLHNGEQAQRHHLYWVTSNLSRRAWEHREALVFGFTARHGCKLLVWFEFHDSMQDAIAREKQIKAGSRKKKLTLIEANNPSWRNLYEDLA